MDSDKCSGALTIQIKVADKELSCRAFESSPVFCIDCTCQPVLGIIGNFQCFVKILDGNNCKNWSEDFLLCKPCIRSNICEDGRFDVIPFFPDGSTSGNK